MEVIQGEEDLKHHKALFRNLKAIHVSSDESDYGNPEQPAFRRVRPAWRSSAFEAFLWRLDSIALARKMEPSKWKQGRGPRYRPRTNKVNKDAKPPSGLPRNCYDPKWLKSMRPFQQKLLDIRENHDFTLPNQYDGL